MYWWNCTICSLQGKTSILCWIFSAFPFSVFDKYNSHASDIGNVSVVSFSLIYSFLSFNVYWIIGKLYSVTLRCYSYNNVHSIFWYWNSLPNGKSISYIFFYFIREYNIWKYAYNYIWFRVLFYKGWFTELINVFHINIMMLVSDLTQFWKIIKINKFYWNFDYLIVLWYSDQHIAN